MDLEALAIPKRKAPNEQLQRIIRERPIAGAHRILTKRLASK